MRQAIILLIVLVLFLWIIPESSQAWTTWQCGKKIVRVGERYGNVLAKCGEPDRYYFYQSDLGLRLGTKLTYHEKKLVILTFQDEFLRNIKQASYRESPVYLFFDRWGICVKIQEGN